jgi:hypothetical protein
MLNLDAERTLRAILVFIESLQHFNSDTVYPINWQTLDQIQLAAAGLVALIQDFMAIHRLAEKPVPAVPFV